MITIFHNWKRWGATKSSKSKQTRKQKTNKERKISKRIDSNGLSISQRYEGRKKGRDSQTELDPWKKEGGKERPLNGRIVKFSATLKACAILSANKPAQLTKSPHDIIVSSLDFVDRRTISVPREDTAKEPVPRLTNSDSKTTSILSISRLTRSRTFIHNEGDTEAVDGDHSAGNSDRAMGSSSESCLESISSTSTRFLFPRSYKTCNSREEGGEEEGS